MAHEHDEVDRETMFSKEHWDEQYRTGEIAWSGNPNPQLVQRLTGVAPGSALEAGAGDGSDAIWLAGQGWQVTALDISQVALDTAAKRAQAAGVAEQLTWQQADLRSFAPPVAAYDLVTAMFVHLPDLAEVNRRLAAAVRPGGHLLIVLHHPDDLAHHWGGDDLFATPEQLAEVLEPAEWDITLDEPVRANTNPRHDAAEVQDAIMFARRR